MSSSSDTPPDQSPPQDPIQSLLLDSVQGFEHGLEHVPAHGPTPNRVKNIAPNTAPFTPITRCFARDLSAGFAIILAALFLVLTPESGWAQSGGDSAAQGEEASPTISAETVLENAETAYGPPKAECAPQEGDVIVVCGVEEDQSHYRVKGSTELNPLSEEALDDGLPRAPDVAGPGIFTGKPTISGMCIPGLQKCPPPPAIIVDVTKLPQAPPGSDADRVARGLAPRGNESGTGQSLGENPGQANRPAQSEAHGSGPKPNHPNSNDPNPNDPNPNDPNRNDPNQTRPNQSGPSHTPSLPPLEPELFYPPGMPKDGEGEGEGSREEDGEAESGS